MKLLLETQTKTKETMCFLPLRQQSQQKITKSTTVFRNKAKLRQPLHRPHHQACFQHQVSPHRTLRRACCTMRHWAFRSSTPPTCCWRPFHAPWSFCPSRCSSWRRLSRSLCVNHCSSSGRQCRFSETSQAEPSHSCTTNWMEDRHYNYRGDVKFYHWLRTWPSGTGTFQLLWTSHLITVLFHSTEQMFCGSILKVYW